ncbi:hypothetical protein CROQUDRAFT_657668 [Cronartium quercuum f. sp. fusiforme G11]|uniref:HAT C-terminal dimerisation domain-containing protein n=1 Tax=Cronartium quercuum f. sp. fusiforme G11 TaxID=708437 RepID=A0A9P6NIG6_9BASI|nr:hypothetical protein CROQUDRAFT_657668 [Cronartium quercuum f. sp. fusiforme G11]
MTAGLMKAYDQLDTHLAIKIAIQPMMDKLCLYCDAALCKPVYVCAVMLDPRQKMDNICPSLITKTEAHNLLSSECKQLCGDNPFQLHHPDQPGSEGMSESNPWALTGAATDPFNIQDEVNSYLTAPIAYKNTHILDWWQLNATQFPNLAIASWAILAVPATSVSSECAFSAGGRICDNLRGSLKAGTIAAQVCLKSWLNFFDSSGI